MLILTFFYWIGIFVISFSILLLIKSEKDDTDDLPLSKEELNYIAIYIAIIGFIILAISLHFLNYRQYAERNLKYEQIFNTFSKTELIHKINVT